jgi:hypothetical protein
MLHRRDFAELSSSLGALCFADDLVVALARTQKYGTVREQDKGSLQKAAEFFENVLSGYGWADNPHLTRESVQSAAAFSEAATVLRMRVAHPAEFVKAIEGLRDTVQTLQSTGTGEPGPLQELREFFANIAYNRLDALNQATSRATDAVPWRSSR